MVQLQHHCVKISPKSQLQHGSKQPLHTVAAIDVNLGHHGELSPSRLGKLLDGCIVSRLLATKLLSRI